MRKKMKVNSFALFLKMTLFRKVTAEYIYFFKLIFNYSNVLRCYLYL